MNDADCWGNQLKDMFEATGDDFSKMITTLSKDELHIKFDCNIGWLEGAPFTAWGEKYVYFPICYDGMEYVGCAPRNPCDEAMDHQGG